MDTQIQFNITGTTKKSWFIKTFTVIVRIHFLEQLFANLSVHPLGCRNPLWITPGVTMVSEMKPVDVLPHVSEELCYRVLAGFGFFLTKRL